MIQRQGLELGEPLQRALGQGCQLVVAEPQYVQGCQRGEGVWRQGVDLVALEAEEGEGGEQGEEGGIHLGQLVVGEVEGLEGEIRDFITSCYLQITLIVESLETVCRE